MSINLIQFQQGLSMVEFMQRFGTEAKAYRALYKARWLHGFRCPACGDRRRSRFRRGQQVYYHCCVCRHETILLSGTIFGATKLSLRTWLLAIHLLTATKTNKAAPELKRHLGVDYKAAWRIKHKVMQAMVEREAPRRLSGFVQIDDAYLGGERNGGKPGRGSENKQAFLIAVQTDSALEHPTYAVIEPVRSFDNDSIKDRQARDLAPDAEVFSDGLFCLRRFADTGRAHTVRENSGGRARLRGQGCTLGQRAAELRQTRHQRQLPRDPARQVRAPLPGRSGLPIQPPM